MIVRTRHDLSPLTAAPRFVMCELQGMIASAVPLRVHALGRICFVAWGYSRATAADMQFVSNAIVAARRTAGLPLTLIAIIPSGVQIPDLSARQEAIRLMPLLDRVCASQYVVLLGDSMASGLLRGALGAVAAITRNAVAIEATVEAAIRHACARSRIDPAVVVSEARALGFM